MMQDDLLIKQYNSWNLFLDIYQDTIDPGRCFANLKREGTWDITDISQLEWDTLLKNIIPEWERAMKKVFNHQYSQVLFNGQNSHVRAYLIPRYNYNHCFTKYGIRFGSSGNSLPHSGGEVRIDCISEVYNDLRTAISSD